MSKAFLIDNISNSVTRNISQVIVHANSKTLQMYGQPNDLF